jgi:hypothetical protein
MITYVHTRELHQVELPEARAVLVEARWLCDDLRKVRPEDFSAEVAQIWRLARDLTDDSMNAAFRRAAHAQQVKHIEIEDPFAVAHTLRMQAVDDHIRTGNHTKAAEEYETLATEYAKLLDLDTTGNAPLSPPMRRHLTRYRADALSMAGAAYAREQ